MSRHKDALPVTWAEGEASPYILTKLKNCPALTEAIKSIQPETLDLGERRLEREIRKAHPVRDGFPQLLGLIKIRFWEEYRLAVKEKRYMRAEDIYHGVASRSYWQKNVLSNPTNLAWIIQPPADELILQKEIIQLGMKRLREAFQVEIIEWKPGKKWSTDKDGKKVLVDTIRKSVNVPLLKELHSIVKSMQDRVHGSVIERKAVEAKNIHVHANAPGGFQLPQKRTLSLNDPNITLEELERFESTLSRIEGKIEEIAPEAAEIVEASLIGEGE